VGGRRRKKNPLRISSERAKKGHRQSDQHWNCLKGNVGELLRERVERIKAFLKAVTPCEPVWLGGKALGWQAEGPRLDSASAVLSLQEGCGLWTLSCAFGPQN